MSKLISFAFSLLLLPALLKAEEPDLWLKIKPDTKVSYWMIFREETSSEFYHKANGTIIPMAIYKVGPGMQASWALSSLNRKDRQVDVIFHFRDGSGREEGFTSNFFSKGDDRKLAPEVSSEEDCFRIAIPEEGDKTRYVVLVKTSDPATLKEKYKVSPLMPVFTWDRFFARINGAK